MIKDIFKLVGAAFEYKSAVAVFNKALADGESLEAALRAFAAETENTVDDRAVDGAIDGIEQAEEFARMVAARSLTVDAVIDQTVRKIAEEAEDVKVAISKGRDIAGDLADFLDGLQIRD